MIIIWPLVVSKTVNPNILPGVCKALERYIYIHELDDVIETANANIRSNQKRKKRKDRAYNLLKKVGNGLMLESVEYNEDDFLEEADKTSTQKFDYDETGELTGSSKTTQTAPTRPEPKERDSYKDAYNSAKAQEDMRALKGEAPRIDKIDPTSINTEPTWNTVTDQEGRTTAIGVKVVPFIINNEQSLIKLMTQDRYRSKLSKVAQFQARRALKIMYRIANVTWKTTLGKLFSWTGLVDEDFEKGTISQNWKNDIVLQNTAFKEKMFILLNKMDLEEDFMGSASGVKSLFKLGWTSFVVADACIILNKL